MPPTRFCHAPVMKGLTRFTLSYRLSHNLAFQAALSARTFALESQRLHAPCPHPVPPAEPKLDRPRTALGRRPGPRHALWRSESEAPPPKRVVVADDRITADQAYRLACEGTGLLWRGDYQNARQLLQAMTRRVDKRPASRPTRCWRPSTSTAWRRRSAPASRMLLIPFDAGHGIPLRRAPDARLACEQAYGPADAPYVASLRELLGLIGAYEWRRKGVEIPALGGDRIHPHYGVFSPVRGEYVDLVAQAPPPAGDTAFDIGVGTGVLSAVLARRGLARVIATDQDARALACARENLERLGLTNRVELVQADLFPPAARRWWSAIRPGCRPAPARRSNTRFYDPESRMLRGFLDGLAAHLTPGGEGWLIPVRPGRAPPAQPR